MLTPDPQRRRLSRLAAAVFTAGAMLAPAGTALAMDAGAADAAPPEPGATHAQATADELRTLVMELSTSNDALLADVSSLQLTVDALSIERDRLRASLERFDSLYEPIEADRQLLFELRKGLPDTRPEAEAQLQRIRSLALASDPARLGQLLDRVDDAAPAFLDWRFGEFETTQEFSAAYVETGANAFDSSMEDFRAEVLMSVANRLDGLLTILDRVR
jgi:hypothetical protein